MADPEISKKEGPKTMYQPGRHLLQMHLTNNMPFIWEKAAYCKKISE